MTKLTCYRCKQSKVSVDHVPPKCLFPKGYRNNNLATVPSCQQHNEAQSINDQVLLYVFSILPFQKNEPYKIISSQILNRHSIHYDRKLNTIVNMIEEFTPIVAHDVDSNRYYQTAKINLSKVQKNIDHALKKIAYGIYYLTYQKSLTASEEDLFAHIDISIKHSIEEKNSIDNLYARTQKIFEHFEIPFSGNEPKVFKYRALHIPEQNFLGFEFLFYEVIKATVTNNHT